MSKKGVDVELKSNCSLEDCCGGIPSRLPGRTVQRDCRRRPAPPHRPHESRECRWSWGDKGDHLGVACRVLWRLGPNRAQKCRPPRSGEPLPFNEREQVPTVPICTVDPTLLRQGDGTAANMLELLEDTAGDEMCAAGTLLPRGLPSTGGVARVEIRDKRPRGDRHVRARGLSAARRARHPSGRCSTPLGLPPRGFGQRREGLRVSRDRGIAYTPSKIPAGTRRRPGNQRPPSLDPAASGRDPPVRVGGAAAYPTCAPRR